MIGHSDRSPRRMSRNFTDLRSLLVHGFVLLLMLIGYTVVWAWWWITRMRD